MTPQLLDLRENAAKGEKILMKASQAVRFLEETSNLLPDNLVIMGKSVIIKRVSKVGKSF